MPKEICLTTFNFLSSHTPLPSLFLTHQMCLNTVADQSYMNTGDYSITNFLISVTFKQTRSRRSTIFCR